MLPHVLTARVDTALADAINVAIPKLNTTSPRELVNGLYELVNYMYEPDLIHSFHVDYHNDITAMALAWGKEK